MSGALPDPGAGLASGPADAADYPYRCRHCPSHIRPHPIGGQTYWLDRDGYFRCMKDMDHEPMPTV